MSDLSWKTSITKIMPNQVRLRGYCVDELMGQITFSQAIYLALIGDLPTDDASKMLDAILVSSIDHGALPPSTLAARTAASTGASLNGAVAAGLLSINRYHGAAIFDCMNILSNGIERTVVSDSSIEEIAREIVSEFQVEKLRIAGLGHRLHSEDPRTLKLFSLSRELDIAGTGVDMMLALQSALAASGKDLPINVDGAIAALLIDMEIPRELANAFFSMARVPGLVAQVYEEQTRERPMRHIHPTDHSYDGPSDRSL